MRRVGITAGIAILAVAITLLGGSRARAATNTAYTYRLDTYALQLNGDAQFVSGLDGGFVKGTVVAEDNSGAMPKKHISGTTIEPIRARVRVDQFTPFIADALEGKSGEAKGAVYYIDNAGKVQQQRDLGGLTLSELAFPAFSGSPPTGNGLLLTLTLTAQSAKPVDVLAGAIPPVKADPGPAAGAKKWTGYWRFEVPGLPTNRVSMIEPFTIRRKGASDAKGQARQPAKATDPWDIPNLVVYMLPQDSQAWVAWHDDFVVHGNNADAQEKTFTLELLSPDRKETILQLDGSGVGIVSAKYEQPLAANAPVTQGFRVELYVERMKLTTPGAPGSTAPTAHP